MNCNQCHIEYSTVKPYLPRVLINCGHTLCEACVEKTFKDRQLICPECNQISYGISFHQYPVNATLLALLKLKEEDTCKVHNQKLQAYCQKDNQLLCLSCVINGPHKTHKISSVAEKVAKDRSILKQCMKQIQQSNKQIESSIQSSAQALDHLQNQYKDYLLQLGLCFTNLHKLLTQLQNKNQQKIKNEYEMIKQRYHKQFQEMKQKKQFMNQLTKIYQDVICLPNIQYLNQDNKRFFIIENCKFRRNKLELAKIGFNKIAVFGDVVQAVQQIVSYEKKLQGQAQQGISQGQTTPVLKSKKSNRTKQPTILEVNLNEQYKKHFKSTVELHPSTHLATTLHVKNKNQKTNSTKLGIINGQLELSRTPKQQKNAGSQKKQAISIAGSSQSEKNNSFHSECLPISMINSFMESSNQSLSIRGSEADFTVLSYDQRIYHFGGFNDSSVEYLKVQDPKSSKSINANIQRSKAQCAIIPSYSDHKCLIFGGKSPSDQKLQTFVQYNLQTNKWTPNLFKLSQPKSGFGSTIKQNRLYIAGGSNNQRSLRSFQQYRITPNSMVKTDLQNMIHCRDQLGMALGFDGKIYACGGINQSGSVLSSCERFNQGKGKWQMVASMNKPRRSFALVSLPHGLYAMGGYDGNQYLKDVQLYDFTLQKWIVVASMNQPRFAHTALVTADLQNIIVSGGFHKKPLKSTEIFDIIHEKWIQGAPLQTQRFLHCSLICNF